MFRRLVFEDSAALFTIAAFITAFTIYVTIAWRALRMKHEQIAHFENLPFETATPSASTEPLPGAPRPAGVATKHAARPTRPAS